MKNSFTIIGFLFLLILSNCDRSFTPEINDSIVGVWVLEAYENDASYLSSKKVLEKDKPGYIFYENGKLLERKNSGWCGTPPISYSNFDGTWTKISTNLYEIEVGYWGGTTIYQLEILSLTETELRYKIIFIE